MCGGRGKSRAAEDSLEVCVGEGGGPVLLRIAWRYVWGKGEVLCWPRDSLEVCVGEGGGPVLA